MERHGLTITIALGESIGAIGVGAAGLGLGPGVILASCFGIALAASLWWAHFDYVVLAAERRLSRAPIHERAGLARDSYSYLHLPMAAGIVSVAPGVKNTLAHVKDPLGTIPAVALCGGGALYLVGHNALRPRDTCSVSVPRLVTPVLCLSLIPMAMLVPALVTLASLAALRAGLAAFETLCWREGLSETRAPETLNGESST